MGTLTITIEEQKIILDLINQVKRTVDPNFDLFKTQRVDLATKLNNNIYDDECVTN